MHVVCLRMDPMNISQPQASNLKPVSSYLKASYGWQIQCLALFVHSVVSSHFRGGIIQ